MARLLAEAQKHGIKTSIDVVSEASDRFTRLVPPSLKYTDYCIINEIEAGQTTGIALRDENDNLLGIFTDGDFRRSAEKDLSVLSQPIDVAMTKNPTFVGADELAVAVLKKVEEKHINSVVVVDNANKVCGLIDVQDLPGLKLM
jgi:arabinose-5-phosphate isomerase